MSGLTPPTDPSSTSRSRSSPDDSNQNPNATRVPAVTTVLVPRRMQLPSSRDAMRVEDSSDTSMEASRQRRFRQRAPHGPNPSNSPDADNQASSLEALGCQTSISKLRKAKLSLKCRKTASGSTRPTGKIVL